MGWLRTWLRSKYESEISTNHGVFNFLANVAFIQLASDEFLTLNPPSKHSGDIQITSKDSRPILTYKFWPAGFEWREEMPVVSVIVEEKRFLLKTDGEHWTVVDRTDPRIQVLNDLFLSFAFYSPLRKEHKKKTEVESAKAT